MTVGAPGGKQVLVNPLGPVATQGGYVAAVENTAPSPGSSVETRGASATGN